MSRKIGLLLFVASLCLNQTAPAAGLTAAHVTKIVNDVKVIDPAAGAHRAAVNETIHGQLALTTGIKSRSELLFEDNTLTRLGPETYFSFKSGTRDLTLEKGTLLLQVPKGLGGAKVHTAAVTASITGTTIMIEYLPKRDIKVLVLEGTLRLSVNGRFGDALLLQPGKMVIMPPNAKRIPDPVTVDLKKIVKTSKLVNMPHGKTASAAPLPSMGLIDKEVDQQQKGLGKNNLVGTNLVILGKGTNVLLASTDLMQALASRNDVDKVTNDPADPPPLGNDVGPGPKIHVHGNPLEPETDVTYGDKGPVSVPLILNTPQDWTAGGGTGSVKIRSNDSVTINTTIKVSDSGSLGHHGEISIDSHKTTGTAIAINSSAQLLALLSAASNEHGMITFKSAGGDIDVTGGTVQADGGTIEIRNTGTGGMVNLSNATLSADTVKVGALGNNGTLTVGGGTISADSVIKLYAGGSNGTVNFIDNVTLSGNSAKTISGDTVTIFAGKTVTVNGPAPVDVFTNNPNYTGFGGNGSTTGTFAGQGAVTHPAGGPGF